MLASYALIQERLMTKEVLLQVAQTHHRELLLHAVSCCGDFSEAEELLGDIYLDIELGKIKYTPQEALPKTFLCAVIRNKSRNLLRKIARRASKYLSELFQQEEPSAEQLLSQEQESVWLRRSMQSLPPRMQEVLRLRFLEGLSVKECQEILGVNSPGTISEQERRGIERLREMAKRDKVR
jgi:RNA polymerase sigma factor (sigma-70 family)